MDQAVIAAVRRQYSQFNSVQRCTRIPVRGVRQEIDGFFIKADHLAGDPFDRIVHSPCDQFLQVFLLQRLQFEYPRTRQQRAVDFKIRVLRRCADQRHRTVLHERQQVILLGFVEPVDLVDEQYRLLPACLLPRR